MNAAATDELRARIVAYAQKHPGLPPREVAGRLGCARSTVYKVLRRPRRDGRTLVRRRPRRASPQAIGALYRLADAHPDLGATRLRRLLAERARDDLTLRPIPSQRTVDRLLAAHRAHRAATPPDPTGQATLDPAVALFAAEAFGPDADLGEAATASLGQLLQQVLADLSEAKHPSRRHALRQQAAVIALGLARVARLGPHTNEEITRIGELLDQLGPVKFPATHGVTPPTKDPRSGGAIHARRTRAPRRRPPEPTPPSAVFRDQVDGSAACHPAEGGKE